MVHTVSLDGGYEISDDSARLDLEIVHGFLETSYWAATRPRALTERAIAHCLCLGLYTPRGGQAGFARVSSDFALRAHLADVFVLQAHRGRGLGRALITCVMNHPLLRDIGTWSLSTRDAHDLYAEFGFGPIAEPDNHMMLARGR